MGHPLAKTAADLAGGASSDAVISGDGGVVSSDGGAISRGDAPTAEPAAPLPSDRIGHYRLGRVVGRGGMGVVHDAWDEKLKRRVAVKVLAHAASSRTALERFRQEATLAARLKHPNVVTVHEAGTLDGRAYIAMEFVEGQTLEDWINDRLAAAEDLPADRRADARAKAAKAEVGAPELRKVAVWVRDVARALHCGHTWHAPGEHAATPIIHRDVKPANVIVDRSGTPRLLDYGLAKEVGLTLTLTREAVGTPLYMSPEQLFSSKRVGPRSDVYSLGMTLYACATLARPFELSEPGKLFEHLMHDDPPSPARLNPNVPRDLETIIRKATEKDERRRYATAADMADDLDAFVEGRPIKARPLGPLGRAGRWLRRHPAVLGTALVLGLGLGGAAASEVYAQATREREEAQRRALADQRAREQWKAADGDHVLAGLLYELSARAKDEDPEGERWLELLSQGHLAEEAGKAKAREAHLAAREAGAGASEPPALRRHALLAQAARGSRAALPALEKHLDQALKSRKRLAELDELLAWTAGQPPAALAGAIRTAVRPDALRRREALDDHVAQVVAAVGPQVLVMASARDDFERTAGDVVRERLEALRAPLLLQAAEEPHVHEWFRTLRAAARATVSAARGVALAAGTTIELRALDGTVIARGRPEEVLEVPPGDLVAVVREPGAKELCLPAHASRAAWGSATPPTRIEVPVAPRAIPADMVLVRGDDGPFLLDSEEVTAASYRAFLDALAGSHERCPATERAAFPRGKDHRPARAVPDGAPVTGIDWWDARAFAAWAEKRLPRRGEWQRAASRAGAAANLRGLDDGWVWASPAASGPLAPCGARNLIGNVAEWLASEDEAYPFREAAGGSWSADDARVARFAPTARGGDLGFRCARDVPRIEAPPPAPLPPTIANARDGARASLVRGGTYVLGEAPPQGYWGRAPRPTHANRPYEVVLRSFYVDEACVTWGQLAAFRAETGRSSPARRGPPTSPDDPALASWEEAAAYAAWAGKRLPSEAEWDAALAAHERGEVPLALVGSSATVSGPTPEWCLDTFHPDFRKHANRVAPVNRWAPDLGHLRRSRARRIAGTDDATDRSPFRCVTEVDDR